MKIRTKTGGVLGLLLIMMAFKSQQAVAKLSTHSPEGKRTIEERLADIQDKLSQLNNNNQTLVAGLSEGSDLNSQVAQFTDFYDAPDFGDFYDAPFSDFYDAPFSDFYDAPDFGDFLDSY